MADASVRATSREFISPGSRHGVSALAPIRVIRSGRRAPRREPHSRRQSPRRTATRCGFIPAYYVITDARIVSVWDFRGAVAPDRELMKVSQGELAGSFDDLYSLLNPRAAAARVTARSAVWRRHGENRGHRGVSAALSHLRNPQEPQAGVSSCARRRSSANLTWTIGSRVK